jgi:hypothetical protein
MVHRALPHRLAFAVEREFRLDFTTKSAVSQSFKAMAGGAINIPFGPFL